MKHIRYSRYKKYKTAFTLLEVIMALSLIVMIVGTVFAYYSFSIRRRDVGQKYLLRAQLGRVVLLQIAKEIRSTSSAASNFGTLLVGLPDSITFTTTVVPSNIIFRPYDITESYRPAQHDLQTISYKIGYDQENPDQALGLIRNALKVLLSPAVEETEDQELTDEAIRQRIEEQQKFDVDLELWGRPEQEDQPILEQEMLSKEIKYLGFEYYDGQNWQDSWQPAQEDLLPQAIRISVGFEQISENQRQEERELAPEDRPWHADRFSLLVKLMGVDDYRNMQARKAQTLRQEIGFDDVQF